MTDYEALVKQHQEYKAQNLSLNMERGQPADANFNLSLPILGAVTDANYTTDQGVDIRNYPGGILGLAEAREIFCHQLNVGPDEIIVGNNSSLEIMGTFLSRALIRGVRNSDTGWIHQSPKLIVTTPGYDRHFLLAEELGYELLPVKMTGNGPDMDAIEAAVKNDPSVKGIYFVPTYSNPTGDTISKAYAERLINVAAAAKDFTIFADDAYAVHHLDDNPTPAPNLLKIAKNSGQQDRVILFGSTSKVTFASGGLGLIGMGIDNIKFWSKALSSQSIGPNKAEQWRHVLFMREYKNGLTGLMQDHAKILKPKFDKVQEVLNNELGNLNLATWTDPRGGYFVSLDTAKPVAARVVELAKEAGLSLTPTGATFPGGEDPDNRNIRLAPTRPPLEEVELAMQIVACCIKLADAETIA